jgi:amidase
MGRNVRDVARLFGVLSATTAPAHDATIPRIVFAHNWIIGHDAADAFVVRTVSQLRSAGFDVVDRYVAMPALQEYNDELTVLLAELYDDLGAYLEARPGTGIRSLADVVAYENAHADTELEFFGHDFFDQALTLGGRSADAYVPARERNLDWALNKTLLPGIDGADIIISSGYGPSWKSDLIVGGHPNIASCASMAPAIAGWPIMSVPIGFVHDLPIGLVLIARPHDEWRLLNIAQQIERALSQSVGNREPTWTQPFRG